MTWADFYLICFAVGFAFSFLSFLAGTLRWHLPRLPHGLGQGPFSVGHASGGHAPVAGGHVVAPGTHGATSGLAKAGHSGFQMSPFNLMTLTAFLAWFGGAGYLLTRYSGLWVVMSVLLATVAGLAGAGIVFLFMTRVLMSKGENMDAADYEMVGVLAKISNSIRAGGTGEIIYSQAGTRRTCGARGEDGSAIAKGEEVVVTRYEKGIAYVRLWQEMVGEKEPVSANTEKPPQA